MIKSKIKIILVFIIGLMLTQCSTYTVKKDMSQKGELTKTPKWYVKYSREDKNWMYETASSVSPDLELSIKKSTLPSGAIIPTKLKEKSISEKDMILVFVILFLGLFSILLGTMIFTLYGYDLSYALFEVTSAFTLGGLSTGITSLTLSPVLKIILVIEMLVGRVEIIPFLMLIRILFKK